MDSLRTHSRHALDPGVAVLAPPQARRDGIYEECHFSLSDERYFSGQKLLCLGSDADSVSDLPACDRCFCRRHGLDCSQASPSLGGGHGLSLSVRDLLAWAGFMTSPELLLGPWEAYVHGAALVLLDGMGLGAGLSPESVARLRKACVKFLKDQVRRRMIDGRLGYCSCFPDYAIHVCSIVDRRNLW